MTRIQKRKIAAAICLVAVAFLYVPYASAAWYTTQHLCCAKGLCETHSHMHETTKTGDEMPMDCGHGGNQMSACKMSCCKTTEEIAVNPHVFVMTRFQITLQFLPSAPNVPQTAPQMISRYDKPQSPPPRLSVA